MRIALALSGGGVRATVFHLGVLARIADANRLHEIRSLSTVSGGSLAAGLIFASNGYQWPTATQYVRNVVPRIHDLLTSRDLQSAYVYSSLRRPWKLLQGRARVLGDEIRKTWGISASLSDLPVSPHWSINSTCYETGKNFRFERHRMGDYQTRYVRRPDFSLAHALACSAAVPGLIGPLVMRSGRFRWEEKTSDGWQPIRPRYKRLHLWDGGVYDNLGIEALFKPGTGLRDDNDFLIVSDASKPLESNSRRSGWVTNPLKASMRLVDIATDQVRSLRARMLVDYFRNNPGRGSWLRLGLNTAEPQRAIHATRHLSLKKNAIASAAGFATTLRRITTDEFSQLFRHGFEVADVTFEKHTPELGGYRDLQTRRIAA